MMGCKKCAESGMGICHIHANKLEKLLLLGKEGPYQHLIDYDYAWLKTSPQAFVNYGMERV